MRQDAPNQPALDATSVLQHCSSMPQWTPDQARSYKEIASKARTAAAQARKIREKLLDKLVLEAANRADLPKHDPTPGTDDYCAQCIKRARSAISTLQDRLDEQLATKVLDAKVLDQLASAISRMTELERTLSNRPLPGSMRPVAPRRAVAVFTPPADS